MEFLAITLIVNLNVLLAFIILRPDLNSNSSKNKSKTTVKNPSQATPLEAFNGSSKVPETAPSKGPQKTPALDAIAVSKIIGTFPEAKVLYVNDGDTIDAAGDQKHLRVRLDSIDCPEDGQVGGDVARYGLIKMIGRRTVRLEVHGLDDFGRTLATVYIRPPDSKEWLNVNERMVTLGHAWVMRRYYDHLPKDRQNTLNRLEAWAQSKKVGLWRDANPIPPWLWRKSVKQIITLDDPATNPGSSKDMRAGDRQQQC